ncbi:sulfite exporter TauE/SafE family protein [Patescibacteria group bacterium]
MLKNIKLKIDGLHCQSCKTLIEAEIDVLTGVHKVDVNVVAGIAEIEFDDAKINLKKISSEIEKLNYTVAKDGKKQDSSKFANNLKPFLTGILLVVIVAVIFLGYFLINNFGGFELLADLNEKNVSYGIIFIIGILASFHCVGMCGGLVVAYSANNLAKKNKRILQPHFHYNLGRLISYTIIGGVLGGLGTFFAINPNFTGSIILFAGIFMVLMGMSFVFKWNILQKIKLRTPGFIAKFLYNQKYSKKPKGPLIVGLLNGFMPCGPLQAMQLFALASGSVVKGSLSMAIYALGTIPLMFGFGAFLSKISNEKIKQIIKVSGILIIILGAVMINRGLTNFGYGLNFSKNFSQNEYIISGDYSEYQTVEMELSYLGYKPNVLYIKNNVPVRWVIDVKQMSGCTNAIMIEELGIYKDLQYGENIIEFTPNKIGDLKFSCWMRMVWGKFVVTDNDFNPTNIEIEPINNNTSQGTCGTPSCQGSCGCGCSRVKINN